MSLAILHRTPDTRSTAGVAEAKASPNVPASRPTWRTCLREVEFLDVHDPVSSSGDRFDDDEAYRVLLEIICGLQSPLAGETQVQGQFKTFLASLDSQAHRDVARIGQRLLADAGDIRTNYLRSLGARSYGSVVRRRVDDCVHVAIIGTGALANEILPFLTTDHHVDQWGRRQAKELAATTVAYRTIASADDAPVVNEPATLIVAAPASAADIARVAARYARLVRVIDLRDDTTASPLALQTPVVTLASIFAEGSNARLHSAVQIDAALAEIRRRSRAYAQREELHPFGWDDLCA